MAGVMMTEGDPTAYRLVGWIRLIQEDCIGIPVFSDGSNTEFVPETDSRLRITAFHAFYNEEGYRVDRTIPKNADAVSYYVGKYVPVPFSIGGLTVIANSELSCTEFLKQMADKGTDGTVLLVADIIDKAENGTFEEIGRQRTAQRFEDRYAIIFDEPPIHSRYWIEQFQHAAMDLELADQSARGEVQPKLALKASEWLHRYMSSGDEMMLDRFLDATERVGYGRGKPVYFRLACHLLGTRFDRFVGSSLMNQVQTRIPEGLYYYELTSDQRAREYTDGNHQFDLIACMGKALVRCEASMDFRAASSLTDLLFGDNELPPLIYTLADDMAKNLVTNIESAAQSFAEYPTFEDLDRILRKADQLRTLRRMMDWDRRATPARLPLGLPDKAARLVELQAEIRQSLYEGNPITWWP